MLTVFSRDWFRQQQPRLLGLANHPATRGTMRALLGIDHDAPLVHLTPYEYTVAEGRRLTSEFHIARAFGVRLYRNLAPLWEVCHWFDMRVANRWAPTWNLGFDTLVSYPDAHPETSSFDGWVARFPSIPESWNPLKNSSTGTDVDDSSASGLFISIWPVIPDDVQAHKRITRAMFLFNISTAIGNDDTVTAGTFSVYGSGKNDVHTTMDVNVYEVYPASYTGASLQDYGWFQTTPFATTKSCAQFDDAGYNDFTLNANGLGHANDNSIVRLGLRNVYHDVTGNEPTGDAGSGQANHLSGHYADDTTAANGKDPKLTLTYTPATPAAASTPRLRWL
jgi:hypothetical protein